MGRPKAWLPIAGELMLQRVVRRLKEAVDPVVVVAAAGQAIPALPDDVKVVRDEEEGLGPLAGLAAGLKELKGKVDAAYLSSCDAPFVSPQLVRRLAELLGNHLICVPRGEDHHHSLAAIYRLEVESAVRQLLRERRLRPFFLYEMVSTRVVETAELLDVDPSLKALRNLNTPEDYEAALRECGEP
jgi:molybdopterin-guanine dinucleotide biosynthesis protein A